jgi:hypothetical protein
MPKLMRYKSNREYNWASNFSRVHFEKADESSSSEDDVILGRNSRAADLSVTPIKRKHSERSIPQTPSTCFSTVGDNLATPESPSYWSCGPSETLAVEKSGKKHERIPIINVDSSDDERPEQTTEQPKRSTPISPTANQVLCSVRGCLKLFTNHQRFIEHVFDKHARSCLGLELRDLGWQPVSLSKPSTVKEMRTLGGIGSLALVLSKFLRVNPKYAKIPLQTSEAVEFRSSIDPGISNSLLMFCEMVEDGRDPKSRLVGAITSINDFLAYILFQAEEITLYSKRRFLRYLSLVRDILLRSCADAPHQYKWERLKQDIENKLSDEVIETVVKTLPMSQLILLATPATPAGAKRAIFAIKRFILVFATREIKFS